MARLITAKEVAKKLSISPITVRMWAREGELPVVKLRGRTWRFDEEAIDRRIKERTVTERKVV